MKIDRGKWREAYYNSLPGGLTKGYSSTSTWVLIGAHELAESLGIELVDSEPPEVELARLVKSRGLGMVPTAAHRREVELADEVLARRASGSDPEDGIPREVRERCRKGMERHREYLRSLEDRGVVPKWMVQWALTG